MSRSAGPLVLLLLLGAGLTGCPDPGGTTSVPVDSKAQVVNWLGDIPFTQLDDHHNPVTSASDISFEEWITKGKAITNVEDELVGLLESEEPDVDQPQIAFAIGWVGTAASIPALSGALGRHTDARVRTEAAAALGRVGDASAIPPLCTAANEDQDPNVRANAAVALGQIGDPEAVSCLGPLLGDPESFVRELAAQALDTLDPDNAPHEGEPVEPVEEQRQEDVVEETEVEPGDTGRDTCCCCVTGVAFGNVVPIDNATHYGHSFDTTINLSYIVSETEGDCVLEWWEKTNIPYARGMTANTWTNMAALPATAGSFAGSWGARTKPCPGDEVVTDTDPPALGKRPGRNAQRDLYFGVKVKSAPGCECPMVSMTAYAEQNLTMVNGAGTNANWERGVPVGELDGSF